MNPQLVSNWVSGGGTVEVVPQDKDVFEGYHYGADMYLTKPFNPMELVTFVKRITQGGSGNDGPKRYDL